MALKTFKILISSSILLFTSLIADPLVTRDDFSCYDTSNTGQTSLSYWPSIAIDAKGYIYQINRGKVDTIWVHQFNVFDNYGNQTQPVINFLPEIINDTNWRAYANSPIYCNDAGNSLATIISTPPFVYGDFLERDFGFIFDSTGSSIDEPICFTCDPYYDEKIQGRPYGAINNSNVSAIVWEMILKESPTKDSVLVRLHYPDSDSLSPVLNLMELPHPLEEELIYEGDYDIFNDPSIGLADDNSFAVSWIARDSDFDWAHVYYVVYNADGTPRTDVMMADCDGSFGDTANCVSENVHRLDMMMAANGDFYIFWYEIHWTAPYHIHNHVWVRGFYPDGSPKYDAVRVNDADTLWMQWGQNIQATLACDDSGNVLVAWSDARLHPDNGFGINSMDVYAQKIDPAGNLVGPNMRINNIPGIASVQGNGFDCDINNAGQAVIIWRNYNQDIAIKAQLMPYDDVGRYAPGDINADLSANIADLTTMVKFMFKGQQNSFWPRDLVDFNGDSTSGNILDLTYLVKYFFKGGPEPNTPDEGIRPNPGKFNPYE